MNTILERKKATDAEDLDMWRLPPGPPVREPQAPPEDGQRRQGILGWLRALLGGLVGLLLINWKHKCPRCRSQAIAMVNTVETSGPGWWSLSYLYRCDACDHAWERAPLWSEDPNMWG